MFCDRNEKMMVENARGGEAEYGCPRGRARKSGTPSTKERSSTELRFVSFRAREQIIKDGRHVGLDFYDLLIEALMGAVPTWAGATYRKQADVQISVCKDGGTVFGCWFLLESVYEGGRRFTVVFAQHPFDAVLQI